MQRGQRSLDRRADPLPHTGRIGRWPFVLAAHAGARHRWASSLDAVSPANPCIRCSQHSIFHAFMH